MLSVYEVYSSLRAYNSITLPQLQTMFFLNYPRGMKLLKILIRRKVLSKSTDGYSFKVNHSRLVYNKVDEALIDKILEVEDLHALQLILDTVSNFPGSAKEFICLRLFGRKNPEEIFEKAISIGLIYSVGDRYHRCVPLKALDLLNYCCDELDVNTFFGDGRRDNAAIKRELMMRFGKD